MRLIIIIGMTFQAIFLIGMMPVTARGQGIEIAEGVTLDGSIRERSEFDGKDFNSNTDIIERSYLRTRLGLSFKRIESTEIYLQIQDSRNLGSNSAGLNNDNNLGVHQAYIKFDFPGRRQLWMQLGRFEVRYGRERLVGAVDWNNVGRSFDGLRFGYEGEIVGIDLFLLKIVERGFEIIPQAGDQHLYGIYTTWLDQHLHLFYLMDYDHREAPNSPGDPTLSRWTLGGYYHNSLSSGFDIKADFAYQAGAWHGSNIDNISAYLIAAELGYQFQKSRSKPRIGGGFDIASGDEGDETDELNTFNDLYYTGHAFRGYMDYFISNPGVGLVDIFLRFSMEPSQTWWLGADFHYFRTASEYRFYDGVDLDESNSIGTEFDFTGKHKIYEGLETQCGLSFFFPSDDWEGNDADVGSWFYFMLSAWLK